VVVAVGLTLVAPLADVEVNVPGVMATLVAPLATQLKVLLAPLFMLVGFAVKEVIVVTGPVPEDKFDKMTVPQPAMPAQAKATRTIAQTSTLKKQSLLELRAFLQPELAESTRPPLSFCRKRNHLRHSRRGRKQLYPSCGAVVSQFEIHRPILRFRNPRRVVSIRSCFINCSATRARPGNPPSGWVAGRKRGYKTRGFNPCDIRAKSAEPFLKHALGTPQATLYAYGELQTGMLLRTNRPLS
jgi:hypothetical protein